MRSTLDTILERLDKLSSNNPPPVSNKSVSNNPSESPPIKFEKFSDFVKDIDDGEDESSEAVSRDRNSRILSAYDTPYGAKNLDGRRRSRFLKPIIDYDDLLEKARDADLRSKTQIVSANMPSDKIILENSLASLNPNAIIKWLKKAHALQQEYPHTKVSYAKLISPQLWYRIVDIYKASPLRKTELLSSHFQEIDHFALPEAEVSKLILLRNDSLVTLLYIAVRPRNQPLFVEYLRQSIYFNTPKGCRWNPGDAIILLNRQLSFFSHFKQFHDFYSMYPQDAKEFLPSLHATYRADVPPYTHILWDLLPMPWKEHIKASIISLQGENLRKAGNMYAYLEACEFATQELIGRENQHIEYLRDLGLVK
jgi:hypothetical protein